MLALQGMQVVLEQKLPRMLIIEVSPSMLHVLALSPHRMRSAPDAAKPREVVLFLTACGYEARTIKADGRIGEIFSESDLQHLSDTTNLAFILPFVRQLQPEIFSVQ